MERLYEVFIRYDELKTKLLLENGINRNTINKYLRLGILERVSLGHYKFCDSEGLYSYGLILKQNNRVDDAKKCYLKCLELDCNHMESLLQILIICFKRHEYEEILGYLEKFSGLLNKEDENYLIYLLQNLTEIPDEYKDNMHNLSFRDIKASEDNIQITNVFKENKVRSANFKGRFSEALLLHNQMTNENGKQTPFDYMHKLIFNNLKKQKIKKDAIVLRYIKTENYDELIDFLRNKKITRMEYYIRKLALVIKEINTSKEIPKTKITSANTIFEAIDGANYGLAHAMAIKFCENAGIEDNPLNILLDKIANLIRELSGKEKKEDKREDFNYFANIDRDNINVYERYIESIYNTLEKNGGIVLIEPMNETFTRDFLSLVSLYSNLKAFIVKNGFEEQIVVRYYLKNDKVNISNLLGRADICFDYGYYKDAIEYYKNALKYSKYENYFIYSGLAFSYAKLKKQCESSKYFVVVNDLASKYGYENKYSEINPYSKVIFEMSEDEFSTDKHNLKKVNKANE